jgi:hypothetical protein
MSGASASASQDTRKCVSEAPMSPNASLPSASEPPLAAVMASLATDQSSLLAAVEDLVQEPLAIRLIAQGRNDARRAASTERSPMQRS